MWISYADRLGASCSRAEVSSCAELVDVISDSEPGDKRSQPWWSPITWTGDVRSRERFESASCLVLDFDSADATTEPLKEMGIEYWVVPSWGWSLEVPKCRVIVRLDEPIRDPATYTHAVKELATLCGADPLADLGRLFYYGHHNPEVPRRPEPRRMLGGAYCPSPPPAQDDTPVDVCDEYETWCTKVVVDPAEVGAVLGRTTPDQWPHVRALVGGDAPLDAGRHLFGVSVIGELAEMLPRCTEEAIQEYLQEAWVDEWPDGEEPRFWSHLHRCCTNPARIAKARAAVAAANTSAALQDALAKFRKGDREERAPWEVDWDADLPEPEWLIRSLHLGPGRAVQFLGKGGSMKTSALMDLCVCAAIGNTPVWDIVGAECPPTTVLWVDGEMGRLPAERKFRRVMDRRGRTDNVHILSVDELDLPLMGQPTDDSDDAFADAMAEITDATGAKLLVIDNLQALAWPDENSRDIRRPLDNLRKRLGARGVTVIIVHHSRKSGQNDNDKRDLGSGHSAIFNSAGAVYHMERCGDDGWVTVTRTKSHSELYGAGSVPYQFMLDAEDGTFTYRSIADAPDPKAEAKRAARTEEMLTRRRILDAIGNGARTEQALLDMLEAMPHTDLQKHLKAMESAGTVVNRPQGKQNNWIRSRHDD